MYDPRRLLSENAVDMYEYLPSHSGYISTKLKAGLQVLIAAVVVVAAVVALIGIGTQPTIAAGVSADDISVMTADGNISSVTIQPEGWVSWEHVDSGVVEIDVAISVKKSSSSSGAILFFREVKCGSGTFTCNTTGGNISVSTGAPLELTNDSDYNFGLAPFELSDFNASEGTSQVTTVDVTMEVNMWNHELNEVGGTYKTTSFDVNVTNLGSSTTADLDLHTNLTTPSG